MGPSRSGWERIHTLEKEGWTRQFVADEPRLSDAVEAYREAGFEVRLEPLPAEPEGEECAGEQECRICFEHAEDRYRLILTRRAS